MRERFGRIKLNRVSAEWEAAHPINPRLLASEVAELLRTLAPPNQPIPETYVSAILSNPALRDSQISYGALADYFESTSQGNPCPTIATVAGPAPAADVLIWRQWFTTITNEATTRAALVAGLALPANDNASVAVAVSAAPVIRPLLTSQPPSGSALGYLKMRQANQRSEGERSAVEQLDEWKLRAQRLEAENASLTGRLALSEVDLGAERDARGAERLARLAAEERADAAETELAMLPEKIMLEYSALARSLENVSALFKNQNTKKGETTNLPALLVVAGLLELLLDRGRPFYNQGSAADAIAMKGWRGAGERKVNGVFAAAKKAANRARKEATAKACDIQESNVLTAD